MCVPNETSIFTVLIPNSIAKLEKQINRDKLPIVILIFLYKKEVKIGFF